MKAHPKLKSVSEWGKAEREKRANGEREREFAKISQSNSILQTNQNLALIINVLPDNLYVILNFIWFRFISFQLVFVELIIVDLSELIYFNKSSLNFFFKVNRTYLNLMLLNLKKNNGAGGNN